MQLHIYSTKVLWLIGIILCLVLVLMLMPKDTKKEQLVLPSFEYKKTVSKLSKMSLIVGSNLKEIQNGYYDFKIINYVNYIKVYINKLWVNFESSQLVEDEYLDKLLTYCSDVIYFEKAKVKPIVKQLYYDIKNMKVDINMEKSIDNIRLYKSDMQLVLEIYKGE